MLGVDKYIKEGYKWTISLNGIKAYEGITTPQEGKTIIKATAPVEEVFKNSKKLEIIIDFPEIPREEIDKPLTSRTQVLDFKSMQIDIE